uniref:RNA-directed DNA polymerase, eukaryota, reverse transcriptase zinc-binding domain protein n=1 Tax=Tanacetum cinerariifolium TaxID=118510 RepID=A0A699W400_TANCI|nr:RNA-directed DNA polymerase, eukaryota, reverse transcriptase zinc-binding domain protein [Tanacetum cinerariifolium]
MDINIDALYNILKQNQGDVNDSMGSKKKTVVVTSDPLALIAEKTKVSKNCKKVKVKDYEYYKTKMLLDQWRVPSYCIVHDGSAG